MAKAKKSNAESKNNETSSEKILAEITQIASTSDLKTCLVSVRERMVEGVAAPIYATSLLNHVLSLPKIYELLDEECKEVARDIWLRIKQVGLQAKNPPLLFGAQDGHAES